MYKGKTAGEYSLKASRDNSRYDPLELGYAMTDDVINQLRICAERHEPIFDEVEYCLCLNVASDPLISHVKRHKYSAYLYLPSPRPEQSCYLYNKITKNIRRLWSLPNAKVMAIISEMPHVAAKWQMTKSWCDSFFNKEFWQIIRKQNNMSMLSEIEYLEANREKLIKSGCNECDPTLSQPFDFNKVVSNKIVDTNNVVTD